MDDPMDLTSTDDDLDIINSVTKKLGTDEYIESELNHNLKTRSKKMLTGFT